MKQSNRSNRINRIKNIAEIALFVAVIALSSWISVPFAVPFTMQTFGIFLAVFCLGAAKGLVAVLSYIVIGLLGAPVFSGFMGGGAVVFGPAGGYIIGFIPGALTAGGVLHFAKRSKHKKVFSFFALEMGCTTIYLFGMAFYMIMYLGGFSLANAVSAFFICCAPYLIPDAAKNILAVYVGIRLEQKWK